MAASNRTSNSVMVWLRDHDVVLCREVANVNPYTAKKGSTQRSATWEKIADTLNNCSVPKFNVDKRSVRDHVGILVNGHKKTLRDEEKATGIAPDEPTELHNLLDTIIALQESSDADQQNMEAARIEKDENDRSKAESIRLKAMEKTSETRKRESVGESEKDINKWKRRSGSDAMVYLTQRAEINYELRQEELKMKKEQQEFDKKQMEANARQQLQLQQQQNEMFRMMQQQQQQNQQHVDEQSNADDATTGAANQSIDGLIRESDK